jgi:hypothetical protein
MSRAPATLSQLATVWCFESSWGTGTKKYNSWQSQAFFSFSRAEQAAAVYALKTADFEQLKESTECTGCTADFGQLAFSTTENGTYVRYRRGFFATYSWLWTTNDKLSTCTRCLTHGDSPVTKIENKSWGPILSGLSFVSFIISEDVATKCAGHTWLSVALLSVRVS